jgi:DNA-binding NtrC family response regulator
MTEKILLVDDDVNLLRDLRRQLSKRFDITIAEGGQQALGLIKSDGPFAVVISDM